MIVWIVPVVSSNIQTIWTITWKRHPDDRERPGRLRRPRSLGQSRVLSGRSCKFRSDLAYANALRRLKRSAKDILKQASLLFLTSNRESKQNNAKMFAPRMGAI